MAASTSQKKKKPLKGYEICQLYAEDKSVMANSVKELLDDEFHILFSEYEGEDLLSYSVEQIFSFVDSYLTNFYCRMRKLKLPKIVKEVADKAKSDSSKLSHLLSLIIQGKSLPLDCLGVGIIQSNTLKYVIDICEGCPYYFKNKFCVLYQNSSVFDEDSELIAEAFSFDLPESKYLALAMFKLSNLLLSKFDIDINNLCDYYMIFNHILVCSKIFELMNPSGDIRQLQIEEAKKLLTSKPLDHESSEYKTYLEVLYSVFNDIKEGKLPYIKAIKRALDKNRDFTNSKYDPIKDAYYSLKGTGQSKFTGINQSIISSAQEIDFYKDLFKEFDDYVGFKSTYREKGELDISQDSIYCIRTVLINNPGKFKGRIIHIFDNPIQDRANFIQRRTKRILASLINDSMIDQNKGREFLRLKTFEWSIEDSIDQKIGIYNFDFSNATDTLDQKFQWEVLNFIFGPEVANFWDTVSKLPKYIQNVDGTYERYDQICGQPQGGLSSFNDFSLAHHFIFLMDMKLLGYENYKAEEFYNILGDDSTCNSVEPEIEHFDLTHQDVDIEGNPRSDIELLHMDICEKFAGFIVNYSKSESTHCDSLEAKLDFAKVTYRNGDFFSPIPVRLVMTYSKSLSQQFAVAIWRGERSEKNSISFMDRILQKYNSTTVTAIVKSGSLPFLKRYKDPKYIFNGSWLARLRYSISISYLNMTLACLSIDDKTREWADLDTYEEAVLSVFSCYQLECMNDVNPHHKVFSMMERNEEIVNTLKDIYSYSDQEDQTLALLLSPLTNDIFENDDFTNEIYKLSQISKILRLSKDKSKDIDLSQIFPDFEISSVSEIQRLSDKFMTRGSTKKPRQQEIIFEMVQGYLRQLDDILGYIFPYINADEAQLKWLKLSSRLSESNSENYLL